MLQPLPGRGLDPVAALDALGLRRGEVDRRGAVGVGFGGGRRIALAAGARVALRRIEHRARLVVVDGQGPELFRRDVIGRKRDLVGLAAVEVFAVGVDERCRGTASRCRSVACSLLG